MITGLHSRALAAICAGLVLAAQPLAAAGPDGAKLYREYCSVCHGDKGDGDSRARQGMQPPPRDFTTPQARAELDRDRMLASVAHGRPGTAMVGWETQLSAADIAAVVDFVRARFMAGEGADPLARGARIFARTCSVCHGDNGAGAVWGQTSLDPPPRNFTTPAARAELSRERMIASVTHGRQGTAMTAFESQLPPADVEAVVDYIRSAFMQAAPAAPAGHGDAHAPALAAAPATGSPAPPQAPPADPRAPLPGGLVGDARTGEAFYLQNCTACHGAAGDGNGPRAYFIFPKPRNFLHASARGTYDRPALFRAIRDGVQGREMPAWGKVLSDQQIADVAEYVYTAFVTAGPAR